MTILEFLTASTRAGVVASRQFFADNRLLAYALLPLSCVALGGSLLVLVNKVFAFLLMVALASLDRKSVV